MRDYFLKQHARDFSIPFFAADGGESDSGGGNDVEQPIKTFTQDELDKVVQEHLERERKKYADYDDLRKSKEKLDELEKSQLSEQEKLKAVFIAVKTSA